MAFVCYTKVYECGTNADGSAMICKDEQCGWVPDGWDPFGSGAELAPGSAGTPRGPRGPRDLPGAFDQVVKDLEAFGIDVSSARAQLDSGDHRNRLGAVLTRAKTPTP